MEATERALYMCRIPPLNGEKYHVVGAVNEAGTMIEPDRAFWTNESVKALMAQGPQPEYVLILWEGARRLAKCSSVRHAFFR